MTAGFLNRRTVCIVILAVFALSLLPMLYIARYNSLAIDDFNFGQYTAPAYRETGSFTETLKAAFHTVWVFFHSWQGTFTAVFFMSFHPGIFNESLYGLGTLLLLGAFLTCGFYFLKVLLIDRFGADRIRFGIISAVVLGLCVHFLPSPVEAFYWWNGGMYYTGYYALVMLLLALLIKPPKKRRKAVDVLLCAGLALLSFFIGGGNFVTALLTVIAAATLAGCRLRFDRKALGWIVPAACLAAVCAGLYIATRSPGAAYRQTLYADSMAPARAILHSFRWAFLFMGKHLITNVPVLSGMACLVPLLYRVAAGSGFSFKYPGAATAFLFGVYASTFTPTLYVMGDFPYPRIHNVSFYSLLLFVLVSVLYWCGWLARKKDAPGHPLTAYAVGALALLFAVSSLAAAYEDKNRVAGVSALRSLVNGQAAAFRETALERRAILLDDTVTDAVLPRYTDPPHILYRGQLGADSEQLGISRFYGKSSVRLES